MQDYPRLGELNLAIIETETSLHEAIMSRAEAIEKAEALRQRVIQLQLELEKLRTQAIFQGYCGQESQQKFKW